MAPQAAQTAARNAAPFDPAEVASLLAWWSADEGKTGSPEVTAWARKAGTGLTDFATSTGPEDGTTFLDYDSAVPEYFDAAAPAADWTTLHENGFLALFAVQFDTSGNRILLDNSVGGNASQRGVHIRLASTNFTFQLSNGTGTNLLSCNRGPSFGSTAPSPGSMVLVEAAWSPELGGYLRFDGDLPVVADLVGSPSATASNYNMRQGERSIVTGMPMDGLIGDIYVAGPEVLEDAATMANLRAYFAAENGITLDDAEAVSGSGSAGTVLV